MCSGTCQCSGKSEIWDVPNVMIDDGPVGDTLTCESMTPLKTRTREPVTLGLAPTFTRRSGRRRSPLCQRAGYKRSDIGQQPSHQHADWCDQYSYCLLSLLTCPRPASSPSLIAKVQEPLPPLPPSAFYAAFPSPVLPPSAVLVLKRL